ncbi:hypothetical protein CC1G_13000 [Coprinopsis cinerea okayama7|uniref:Uncharacterized protein n=1 Tax=Coprinopsis cinerea (strain Okayama-7 / 130 / ATCC MYA-4618 / FGSC 9003) TaxID=240176 RepID=A8P6W5_COPC7|nr:hypothetical protein CC1G_13000 [Coprinopsis cinerea okayama7\|eukprot:XP_001839242.1 hypothetical protein CC1G_13000 [Coprinopsis cinerea okayama7\
MPFDDLMRVGTAQVPGGQPSLGGGALDDAGHEAGSRPSEAARTKFGLHCSRRPKMKEGDEVDSVWLALNVPSALNDNRRLRKQEARSTVDQS